MLPEMRRAPTARGRRSAECQHSSWEAEGTLAVTTSGAAWQPPHREQRAEAERPKAGSGAVLTASRASTGSREVLRGEPGGA